MKDKLYTVSGGRISYIVLMLIPTLIGLDGLIFFNIFYIILALILFAVFAFVGKKEQLLNYILIDNSGVQHKGVFYSWDTVCVTVAYEKFLRPCRIYFYNNYLSTKKEVLTIDKSGFCLNVNRYNLEYIMRNYCKQIVLLSIKDYFITHPKNVELIKEHNKKIKNIVY